MINKEYIDKITKHYNDLHDEYKKLEDIVEDGNTILHSYIDNDKNLYAYSDRIRLFEVLRLITANNYSSMSDFDLINRAIHFIAIQYEMLLRLRDYVDLHLIELRHKFEQYTNEKDKNETIELRVYYENILNIVNNTRVHLVLLVQTLVSTVSLDELPKYISTWVTKYADLQQVAAELKRNKIIANGVML